MIIKKRVSLLLLILILFNNIGIEAKSLYSFGEKSIILGKHENIDEVGNKYYYKNNNDIGNPEVGGYGDLGDYYKNGEVWSYEVDGEKIIETVHFIVLDKEYENIPEQSVIFCIQPLKSAEWIDDTNPGNSHYNNLSKEEQKEISDIVSLVISNFSQTGNYDFLSVGQLMIWETVGATKIKIPKSLEYEWNLLSKQKTNYNIEPSFINKKLELTYDKKYGAYTLYLEDTNEILDDKYLNNIIGNYNEVYVEDGPKKNDLFIWTKNKNIENINIPMEYNPMPKEEGRVKGIYYNTTPIYINSGQDLVTGLTSKNSVDLNMKINEAKGKVSFSKLGCFIDECNPLEGVEFGLYDINNNLLETKISDEFGNVSFENLSIGRYYVQEIKTQEGYLLDDTKYYFSIIEDNDDIELNMGNPIVNQKSKGKVSLLKVGETSLGDKPLDKVKFNIYFDRDCDEYMDQDLELADSIETDKEGRATSQYLEYGCYILEEESTQLNYELNEEEYPFEIQKNEEIVLINEGMPIVNRLKRGSLEIIKKESGTNNKLEGASFIYYEDLNKNGILDETEIKTKSKEYLTNKDGKIKIQDIPYGSYLLQEESAPNGYEKKEDIYPFEIKESSKNYKITVYNNKLVTTLVKTGTSNFKLLVIGVIFLSIIILIYKLKDKEKSI